MTDAKLKRSVSLKNKRETPDAIPQETYGPETKSLAQPGGDERVSSAGIIDLTIPAHLRRERAA